MSTKRADRCCYACRGGGGSGARSAPLQSCRDTANFGSPSHSDSGNLLAIDTDRAIHPGGNNWSGDRGVAFGAKVRWLLLLWGELRVIGKPLRRGISSVLSNSFNPDGHLPSPDRGGIACGRTHF